MKDDRRLVKGELLIIALVFAAGFLVSCFIHYSDGDDAIFLGEIAARPRFFDFFTYLTKTMNGRLSATASLWVVFHFSIWVWRILNGLVIAAFSFFFSRIVYLLRYVAAKAPASSFASGNGHTKPGEDAFLRLFGCIGIALFSFLIIGTGVIGYSCLWISGSVNYLWPFTAALIFMYPVLLSVYRGKRIHPALRCLSTICGVYAALCQEQVALCLLAFLFLLVIKNYRDTSARSQGGNAGSSNSSAGANSVGSQVKRMDPWLIVSLLLIIVAVGLLIGAPFTEKREAKELQWLPGYENLSLTGKMFLMVQFVAHSFTHGLRFAMILLWVILGKRMVSAKKPVHAAFLTVFSVLACVAAFLGKGFTDVGLDGLDMDGLIDPVPSFSALSSREKCVLLFWLFALAYTLVLLIISGSSEWKSKKLSGSGTAASGENTLSLYGNIRGIFLFLAALASAAIMVASPSIYASGERTLFVSGMMLMLLSSDCLEGGIHPVQPAGEKSGMLEESSPEEKKKGMLLCGVYLLLGILQLLSGISLIRDMLG